MLENAIEMLRSHLLANAQFATDLASITEKTYQARGYAVDSTTLNDYHARKPAERVESALLNEPVKQKDIESYLLKREQETRNIKDYIDDTSEHKTVDLFENIDNLDIKDIGLPLDPLITALATIRAHMVQFEHEPKINMRLLELVDNMALTRGRWGV